MANFIGTGLDQVPLNQYLGSLAYQNANSVVSIGLGAGTAALPSLYSATNTSSGLWFPAANTIAASVNGAEGLRLTTTGLGIGTSSPDKKLVISGAGSQFMKVIDTTNSVNAFYGVFNSAAWLGTGTNHNVSIATNDTIRATFDTSGNLGLGVTPSGATVPTLQGSATLNVTTKDDGGMYLTSNAYTAGGWKYAATGTNSAAYYLQYQGAHYWQTAGAPAAHTAGNTISFTQAMTLDASGNLGVGTTTLFSGVTIADATNINNQARLNLRNNNSDGSNRIGIIGYNSNSITIQTGNESTGTANNTLAQFKYDYIIFSTGTTATNPTERARIDSSGNLGVGTTSPSTRIHAVATGGAIRMQDSTGTAKYVQMRSDSTNSHLEHVGGPGDALRINNQAAGTIEFFTSNTERARIDSSGNVGIGTSSPSGKLHVYGGAANTNAYITTATSSGYDAFLNIAGGTSGAAAGVYMGYGADADEAAIYRDSSSALVFRANNAERARINSSGAWSFGSSGTNTGTSGQVLTSQGSGSAPTWATAGGGSWTYLSTVTASGAATADVETTFDSTYDMYAIVGVDFYPSTTAVNIYCRLKVAGSYRTTGYSRVSYGNYTNSGGAGLFSQGATQTYILMNTSTVGAHGVVYNGAEDAGFFIMYIQKPARTSANQSVFGQYIYTPEDAGSTLTQGTFAGAYKGGYGALTGVRFLASSGNINGTFRLYGIKNS